jgi:hypothetical protein
MNRITGYTTNNLKFVSTGLCPDCIECAELFGVSIDELNQGIENDDIFDEGSFSWYPCDDCNTNLGGDSFIAHGIDKDENLIHFTVCLDCLMELNGYTIDKNGDYIR